MSERSASTAQRGPQQHSSSLDSRRTARRIADDQRPDAHHPRRSGCAGAHRHLRSQDRSAGARQQIRRLRQCGAWSVRHARRSSQRRPLGISCETLSCVLNLRSIGGPNRRLRHESKQTGWPQSDRNRSCGGAPNPSMTRGSARWCWTVCPLCAYALIWTTGYGAVANTPGGRFFLPARVRFCRAVRCSVRRRIRACHTCRACSLGPQRPLHQHARPACVLLGGSRLRRPHRNGRPGVDGSAIFRTVSKPKKPGFRANDSTAWSSKPRQMP
jgi:hypothetical protein